MGPRSREMKLLLFFLGVYYVHGFFFGGRNVCPEERRCGGNRFVMSRIDPRSGCTTRCVNFPGLRQRLGGWFCGDCNEVLPDDVTLVPPSPSGPSMASITAYSWVSTQSWPSDRYERPIYQILDRDRPEYWNYVLDEILLSRQTFIFLHGRGCWDANPGSANSLRGTGNMCPRLLTGFVQAVERLGLQDIVRVGMWDDTGMYRAARNVILGRNDTLFDVGDESNWRFFWDHNIRIFFDTIPGYLWHRINGRPVIASWHLRNSRFSNQQGNASRMLQWIKGEFRARYGVDPFFILDRTWFEVDSTVSASQADGQHTWFNPLQNSFTYNTFRGSTYGVVVPGFRDENNLPGCGTPCREIPRRNGQTLIDGLAAAGTRSGIVLLEGWTNMIENGGFYRSSVWDYPTQYINIVREFSDPAPETLLFQAEGADRFFDTTSENQGGQYAVRALDVGALSDGTGWFVGWTQPGEWLEYQQVRLGCGVYRFTAKLATSRDNCSIRLGLGNLPSVDLPNTGGRYVLVHLGEVLLTSIGRYDLRIEFESDGIDLDWFFSKRTTSQCRHTETSQFEASPNIELV